MSTKEVLQRNITIYLFMRTKLTIALLFLLFFSFGNTSKAQNMPQNLREHLSLMHTGKIDTNYLQNPSEIGHEWIIAGNNTAFRNPPTGIITSYTLHLVTFAQTAWLVEFSQAYQHDGERLELIYFNGKNYEKRLVPYAQLEAMARKELRNDIDTNVITKNNIYFELSGNEIHCQYQKSYAGYSSLKVISHGLPFAIIYLNDTNYQLQATHKKK